MINLDNTSSTKTRVLSDGELFQVVGGFGHHRWGGNHGGGNEHRNGNQRRNGNQQRNGGGDTFFITINQTTNNFF